jgi:hypothetical protein
MMNPLNNNIACKHVILRREAVPAEIPDNHLVVFCQSGAGCDRSAAGKKVDGRSVASGEVRRFSSDLIERLATPEEVRAAQQA